MNEYLTIPEFAKLAGVSHQAIYKQLHNKLQPYLQIVDGKKLLDKKALGEVYRNEVVQPNADFATMVAALEKQLEVKDSQLEAKDEQLRQKDAQIESLHRIIEQNNTLALADKKSILQLTDGDGEIDQKQKRWFQFWK